MAGDSVTPPPSEEPLLISAPSPVRPSSLTVSASASPTRSWPSSSAPAWVRSSCCSAAAPRRRPPGRTGSPPEAPPSRPGTSPASSGRSTGCRAGSSSSPSFHGCPRRSSPRRKRLRSVTSHWRRAHRHRTSRSSTRPTASSTCSAESAHAAEGARSARGRRPRSGRVCSTASRSSSRSTRSSTWTASTRSSPSSRRAGLESNLRPLLPEGRLQRGARPSAEADARGSQSLLDVRLSGSAAGPRRADRYALPLPLQLPAGADLSAVLVLQPLAA